MSRIVIGLMQCLDTLSNDTVLLGATNRLDIIDEALLRRFTVKHEVNKFNIDERKKMVIKFFDDVDYSYSPGEIQELIINEYTQAELATKMVKVLADSYMS